MLKFHNLKYLHLHVFDKRLRVVHWISKQLLVLSKLTQEYHAPIFSLYCLNVENWISKLKKYLCIWTCLKFCCVKLSQIVDLLALQNNDNSTQFWSHKPCNKISLISSLQLPYLFIHCIYNAHSYINYEEVTGILHEGRL